MGKILPILLAVIGIGAGVGAGLTLRPDPVETADAHDCPEMGGKEMAMATDEDKKPDKEDASDREYVKLNNQFVVPVVADDLVDALVVMSLSIEVSPGQVETVYSREPKLRDAFLQVLFDHANIGGFHGEFTNANNMDVLRAALTQTAQQVIGDGVSGILITDIARQDV